MDEVRIYEPTTEEVDRAVALLTDCFAGTLGFPETEGRLRVVGKGLARIVWWMPRSEIMKIVCPREPEKWTPHHIVGDVPDHDWLMEAAIESCERFPSLLQFRRLHDRYVPNRDGRESEEVEPA